MPQKQVPKLLVHLAFDAVGDWFKCFGRYFIEQYDSTCGQQIETLLAAVRENLFSKVPCDLLNEVSGQILQSVAELVDEVYSRHEHLSNKETCRVEMQIASELSQVAMHPHITSVHISKWPTTMQHILFKNLCQLPNIKYLHSSREPKRTKEYLYSEYESPETEVYFLSGLQSMTKLTTFYVSSLSTDAMINALGRNCPALQKLDITSSKAVTDCGLSALFNCKHLREVNLRGTSVTSAGLKDLLLNLPDILNLGICDEFGSVLEQLHEHNPNPLSSVALSCKDMTSKQLELLVHYCPSLTSIHLFYKEHPCYADFTILKDLQNLKDLTLNCYDFYPNCIKQLLEYIGYNLSLLSLNNVLDLDLVHISQNCPNLQDISFGCCDFADQNLINFDLKNLAVLPFAHVESLSVSDFTQDHLEILMTHCENVKFIHLSPNMSFCDVAMSHLFAKNQMKSLEELIIDQRNDLSMVSVELLMTRCDWLHTLGYLEKWEGISSSELTDFQAYIRSNNIKLTLLEYYEID